MNILVTGVEQYVGNSIARFFSQQGYSIIPYRFSSHVTTELSSLCKKHKIEHIIHSGDVPNISYIESLLTTIHNFTISSLIFCSSADVYGIPLTEKVEEKQKRTPITTYGKYKKEIEELVEVFSIQHSSVTIALVRLFMVTGADAIRGINPLQPESTDFMIRLMRSFANRKIKFVFYGDDYLTPDGYPIRDFIHIIDVCEAIEKIFTNLSSQPIPYIEYNLGSSEGYSLSHVVNRASEVLQMPIYTTVQARKEDEVARLVADISRMKLLFNWKPRYPLDQCILSTWQWYVKQI